MARKSYEERLNSTTNPLLKKLFKIIIEKKSNLCVAANFKTLDEILKFIEKAGQHICVLKTQVGRIEGGNPKEIMSILYKKKKEYNFLLFEDMKWCDGMETIESVYAANYVQYVDLVTVMPSNSMIKAIENVARGASLPEDEPRGCFAVCQVSFDDFIPMNEEANLEVAVRNSPTCVGIIAQSLQVPDVCSMIKATPGVHISKSSDDGNQNWNHPSEVINSGADIVIVGRGIVSAPADEVEAKARLYKEVSYAAYLNSLNETIK